SPPKPYSFDTIIRCFLGDLHVVDMRLAHAGCGDLDELRAGAQRVDRGAAAVAHGGAHAAHELLDDRGERPLVRHPAFDTFGHEFLRRVLTLGVLEVTIARSLLHRAERTHASIALVRAALIELDLAGRLLGAREEAPQHYAGSTGGDGFRNVAGVA